MKRIYLDYAATTPVAPEVMAAMRPYFSRVFGNAGSLHSFGQEASAAIFCARQTIARALGCSYKEIIFTGSATEANNLALRGVLGSTKSEIRNPKDRESRPRIIVSAIEHGSVLETARDLERDGVEVVYVPVNREGIVDVGAIRAALNERTVLVSVQYANNEIGTIQPIQEISKIVKDFRDQIRNYPLFHVDAVQAFQYMPCRVDELGCDFLTLSAHKIYGPKGVGLLYISRKLNVESRMEKMKQPFHLPPSTFHLSPIITGGHQEFGLRAGTENTPYIAGFAKAVGIVEKMRKRELSRIKKLRDYFWGKLQQIFPQVQLNGSPTCPSARRLPNILNVYFPGRPTGDFLIALDVAGVAASPGSACQAHVAEESYVVRALGYSSERASQSVRFTLGRSTTKIDLDRVLRIVKNIFYGK